MADSIEAREVASEIPGDHLPPVEYRDLPEPVPLRKIVGASVIILATALGSGEYVLWPYITSQVGFIVIWAAVLGFLFQYFINMEVERYTLATGETVITGFTRLWRYWGVLFIAMAMLPNFWPGWATGAGTAFTFVFGLGEGAIVPITILGLVAIGIALTLSPVVYQFVEKFQMVMVSLIMAYVVIAVLVVTDAQTWGAFGSGMTNVGRGLPEAIGAIGATAMLGAIAFAGAGGTNNLVQSNWIRDKQMGMGAYIPRIVSPITGEEEARAGIGYIFPQTEENLRRWRGWWKVANQEQFITFFVIGVLSLILLCSLTYATVFGQVETGEANFDFIRLEGEALKQIVAPWFGTVFWLTGVFVLFSTNLGILDYVSRLTADVLKVDFLNENEFWSESKLYFAVVWSMIAVGSLILLSGLDQPLVLLIIASSLSGLVMVVYTILLIVLNRRVLPEAIKLKGFRLGAMFATLAFFLFFVGWMVLAYAQQIFGGGG
ncbi:hypothetical protein E0L93_15015 [Rubrobacter taiwanensis]|uniref:Divalent metal cation transporter n=1 Tax=Rubrobacter taiwanensis TaxID=185139 RepID=A0A4R1B860_9ACTN|nr:Nramp family divalent metal transporter [Rubrobacter taiwanensis]TCJ13477.1 hypothetical protein E0L93_15015 [Rubrobacter taiwanensis]